MIVSSCQQLSQIFNSQSEKSALVFKGKTWTYRELYDESFKRAELWKSSGLKSLDRILLLPGDRLEFIFCALAASIGNFELVSVSQKATADEIQHIKQTSQAKLEWSLNEKPVFSSENKTSDFHFNNIDILFFTSGTTSLPKGVVHNFGVLLANAAAFNARSGLTSSVRMLHVMPVGYMAGILNTVLSPLMAEGTIVLEDVFDAKLAFSFWKILMENNVNTLWLSPTMVATVTPMCRGEVIRNWTKCHLKHVFVGTAPLHETTRTNFREVTGVDCLESYGMTECMFVSVNHPDLPNLNNSVGLILSGVEIEARDTDNKKLSHGTEGDLFIRSPYMLKGYLDSHTGLVGTAASEDGWLNSGDIGVIDADGRMTITGRKKDLIIHGGTNVSPKAVEDVMLSYPGIRDIAVVGVPHTFWGEEVIACIITQENQDLELSALKQFCSEKMGPDARPSRFIFMKEFPRSSSGKIQKHLLRNL